MTKKKKDFLSFRWSTTPRLINIKLDDMLRQLDTHGQMNVYIAIIVRWHHFKKG